MYDFDISVIINALPAIVEGLKLTVFISLISSVIAFLAGCVIAYLRISGFSLLNKLCVIYVEIVRNTPLLIQLYIYYKGLPGIGISLSPVTCGVIALSIYTSPFISEVVRSGINSIAKEQYQAARGLGLSEIQTFMLIIFPQAIRIIIPPLGSQFINLVKNSSLVSFIAVTDLFYVIYKGAADDFRFAEFFVAGALCYMILTGTVALFFNFMENKFRIPGSA